ncbi:hypothetical protein JB92DRAFT_256655 [Gautieria morchelliformis]|nr:hypothetical protein JB92DRAFT_256655 [Gautieria morchelliformis]
MGFTLPSLRASSSRCQSAGGSPLMASLPHSPTSPSLADRFVLPRAGAGLAGGSGSRPVSPTSSPRALAPESSASGSGSPSRASSGPGPGSYSPDTPAPAAAPTPSPALLSRCPSINAIHLFKSATLSSGAPGSPTFHSPHSPSFPSFPSVQSQHSQSASLRHPPLSGSGSASTAAAAGGRAEPPRAAHLGVGGCKRRLRIPPCRPSRRTGLAVPHSIVPHACARVYAPPRASPPAGKRYSNSFGHRYAASASVPGAGAASGVGGSDGSPGSFGRRGGGALGALRCSVRRRARRGRGSMAGRDGNGHGGGRPSWPTTHTLTTFIHSPSPSPHPPPSSATARTTSSPCSCRPSIEGLCLGEGGGGGGGSEKGRVSGVLGREYGGVRGGYPYPYR